MKVGTIVLHNYVNALALKTFVTLQRQSSDCAELWGYTHQANVYRISCHKVKQWNQTTPAIIAVTCVLELRFMEQHNWIF